jgi:hypothetical protein
VLEESGASCTRRCSRDTPGAEEDTSGVGCNTGAGSTAAGTTEGGVESSCVVLGVESSCAVLGVEGAPGKICASASGAGCTSAPARSRRGAGE